MAQETTEPSFTVGSSEGCAICDTSKFMDIGIMTIKPGTTDDLPPEVERLAREIAKARGCDMAAFRRCWAPIKDCLCVMEAWEGAHV